MDNPPRTLLPKGTWRTYTTADGLAGLQTEHIAQDAEGYLWIGTFDDGVCRFDGDEFRPFTTKDGLPSNRVQAILLDRQGRLWFGTDRGVCWYEGGAFHRFAEKKRGANVWASFLFEDRQGRLWLGGPGTLGFYHGDRYCDLVPEYCQHYGEVPSRFLDCDGIAQDRDGDLWFGFDHLVRYDGTRFQRYEAAQGLADGRCAVCQAADGALRIGIGAKIWRFDGGEFQALSAEVNGPIRKIQQDREGRTWYLGGGGAQCGDGVQFQHFTTQDGLAFNVVNAIYQDREGLLWFATWGGGLSCYDPDLQVFGQSEGLRPSFKSVLAEDLQGRVWIGVSSLEMSGSDARGTKTIARYDGEGFTLFGKAEGLDLGVCEALCLDRAGRLWLGGSRGLARCDGEQFQRLRVERIEEGFGEFAVSAIAEDQDGHLLLAHWERTIGDSLQGIKDLSSPLRITRFDGQGFHTLFRMAQAESDFFQISAIAPGRNREFYFGLRSWSNTGPGKGLGRWDEAEGVTFFTAAEGLADDHVKDLLQDHQGRLWVATPKGVSLFDGARFQNFTTEQGLPSNQVHCICEDRQGRLWFGTDHGVALYDGQHFQAIQAEHLISTTDILEDRKGRLWFASRAGVALYTPHHVPPRIRLLQVVADQVYQEVKEIKAPSSTPQVVFEYKGLSFRTHPCDMLYTCRLLGREEEWQPATRSMRALYQDLPVGEYTFQVRAIDRDLNYSDPVEVYLTIVPDPRDARIDELEQRVRERTRELEAANRRLTVEAAAERVRSEALSMRSTDDLLRVVAIMFRELLRTGTQRSSCNIFFIDEETDQVIHYNARLNAKRFGVSWTSTRASEFLEFDEEVEAEIPVRTKFSEWRSPTKGYWLSKKSGAFTLNFTQEETNRFFFARLGGSITPAFAEFYGGEHFQFALLFSYGIINLSQRRPIEEEDQELLRQFSDALSLGFRRYLDFQRLEAQNRALEEANAQIQQANQHKSQFLSRMSHDLRTPMNAIIGYNRILLRKAKDALDERQYQNLQNIQLSADHLLGLINDILDLSRVEAGRIDLNPAPVDLAELVAQCAAAVESLLKSGVELRQEVADLAPLHTDADRLSRVLVNLLSNAVKFTEAGRITVSARWVEGAVELAVVDTGIGIPGEDLPHIFEEFRQSSRRGEGEKQGSGLGLAIARKSVELLGGTISVESQVGKGTKFTLRIRDYEG